MSFHETLLMTQNIYSENVASFLKQMMMMRGGFSGCDGKTSKIVKTLSGK